MIILGVKKIIMKNTSFTTFGFSLISWGKIFKIYFLSKPDNMGTKNRTSTNWLSNNFFTLDTNSVDGVSVKKKKKI